MPKVTNHELKKLSIEILQAINEKDPDKKARLTAKANTFSKLLIRRHGFSEKNHVIDIQDGRIMEVKPIENLTH